MTPNKKISSVIRISQEERDASARATHLEAAIRKFLVTTIERKQMSSKTNFKRIALVAVAALGLGVLSSVPSQAVTASDTWTITAGTQSTAGTRVLDSGTASSATFTYISSAAQYIDSYVVSIQLKSSPSGSTSLPYILVDTYNANTIVDSDTVVGTSLAKNDTVITNTNFYIGNAAATNTTAALVSAKLRVMMDNPTVAGTYVVTIFSGLVNATTSSGSDNNPATGTDVTITVAAPTRTADQARSTAYISAGEDSGSTAQTVDSAVVAVSTASTTARGEITVTLKAASSANDTYTRESVTVTTTVGLVGPKTGGGTGRSVVFATTAGTALEIGLYSDGTAGTATITITSASTSFTKTATFYGADPAKITAGVFSSVIDASELAVYGIESDALGNVFAEGTDIYAYSSDTKIVSNYGTACASYNSTLKGMLCTLTGVKNGTVKITLRDASTVALSTVASNEVEVTVNLNPAASIKLALDKATYAPGEKATLLVRVLDSAGKSVAPGAYSNAISSAGITGVGFNLTAISGQGDLAATTVTTAANLAATAASPVVTTDPAAQINFTMPTSGGTLKITAKGGAGLLAAGQVEVTTSATITDNAAAALAAVTALATTVASLRTLITTLTNLVLKIQKKVRA
jgi:hypothetical protein